MSLFSACQILFEGRRASGVLFRNKDGKQQVIRAKKEIILCAGTIGSAKLLMLSGVGPRQHLQSLKVYNFSIFSEVCKDTF